GPDGIYFSESSTRPDIAFYGIIIMLGVLAAAYVAAREFKRRGVDAEKVWDALPWVVIAGIVGARLWHVFTPTPQDIAGGITTEYYLQNPLALINIRQGGLGIPGAVIGGALAVFIYSRIKKMRFTLWTDSAAPGLILAQGIGRWGNFFNQELYGAPTTLPWGIQIDGLHRVIGYTIEDGFGPATLFHPLFLYESIWNISMAFLLLWIARKFTSRLKNGDVFLLYLIAYPLIRFLLDFLRLNAAKIGGINVNQAVMLVVMVLAAGTLILRHTLLSGKPSEGTQAGNAVAVVSPSQEDEPNVEIEE
ncbi:MAG TPA: prolipoprotein diacylglyceryl transferase, partial [Anaerolineaceae bacterium]|nr:prolipoprotein diacylglyceryl transferase [Anaerolineaceae bacterium]